MKRVKFRKFSCLILAICTLLSLLPTQAFAILGAVGDMPLAAIAQPASAKSEGTVDGSQIYSLKMDDGRLVFNLALDGTHAGKSVTTSDFGYTSFAESVEAGVYEQARFTLQTGKSQKELKLEKMEVISNPEQDEGFVSIAAGAPTENSLTVRCTFSGYGGIDPHVACYITYFFVELDAGVTDGELTYSGEENDGHTCAIVAVASWTTENDNTKEYVFRYFQDYHGFSRMGHAGAEPAAHVKLSRAYTKIVDGVDTITAKSTDITTGLGRTAMKKDFGTGDISEIYSDSYGVDCPFVLADVDRVRRTDVWTPIYMTYDASDDCLIAEGYTDIISAADGFRQSANAMHVWGFRDVYTKQQAADKTDVRFSDPDAVNIPLDADRLGFYGTDDGVVVKPITDTARENVLKKQYGDPLYILRGDFELKTGDDGARYYEFTDDAVALTSTITAAWYDDDDYFRVFINGQDAFTGFETTSGVNYSTPTFKLYSPKDGVTETAELAFETETDENGETETFLALSMDPEKNDVLVFIDIPEISSKIDTAQIGPDGDIILSGQMGLDAILNCSSDRLAVLEALGYGPKETTDENGNTTVKFEENGIKASGNLDTGSLLGLDLAEIEAAINTFDGEEQYDFSLELNAFDLFETKAELQLKRLYNGRLAPNNLYFALAAGPGIPLVPPIPTAYLKGGGGGFYGLADTINGDYIAIPPMRLKISAKGDYLKIIEGWLNVTIGPSYLEYSGNDITIAKADVLDSFNMYLKLVGEKRKYNGISYTGLRAGGGMGVTIKAPEGDEAIFEVEGSVEASMFGGLDNYTKPTSAYIQLDSRGSITGKVMIPKKIGKTELKKLGGKTLADTTVDFILGAQTAIDVDPDTYAGKDAGEVLKIAASSAWDDLSIYGGVSKKGTLLLINYRIYYIIPKTVGGAIDLFWNDMNDWSLEDEIGDSAWNVSGKKSASALSAEEGWLTETGRCLDAETGEQVGIAVMESSLYALPEGDENGVSVLAAPNGDGTYSHTVEYDADADENAKIRDCGLGLVITPKNGATIEELRAGLTVSSDGTDMDLEDAVIENGELNDGANITEIGLESGESALLVDPGCSSGEDHTWTVTASCDFDCTLMASAEPTGLELSVSDSTAESTVTSPRDGKEYAIRYYFDAEADRSGDSYFIEMQTLGDDLTDVTFDIPEEGTLAPSGEYYITAVLVEKVTGDFDGDGEDEEAWVTVDTKTSGDTLSFRNTDEPDTPENVELDFTGNETLTASWDEVSGADGYRVTLYYMDGGDWEQAGGSYVLSNADFAGGSAITAASIEADGRYALRMAPTVSGEDENGNSDAAPADRNYRVEVEAYRGEDTGTDAASAANLRYFSKAAVSGEAFLAEYSVPEVTVTYGNDVEIKLDGTNGYGTLVWSKLPEIYETLFTVSGEITDVSVTVENGTDSFTLYGDSGTWYAESDETAQRVIAGNGRVRLTVTSGKDVTTFYLRLLLDDTAPVLTLDASNIAADPKTGKFVISGTTEPGLTASLETDSGEVIEATAGADGRFTLEGTLGKITDAGMTETDGFESLISEVKTQDEAGNAAEPAPVLISARDESDPTDPDDPDKPDDPPKPEKPSGGSGSERGTVVISKTENGTVTVSSTVVRRGDDVTITVTPDSGYELGELTVTDSRGNWLELTENGGGSYTFTMPSSNVTVRAAFTENDTAIDRFVDVKDGDYFREAVLWAVKKGITSGTDASHFTPNGACTRAQAVTFLWRAAGSPVVDFAMSFTDVSADAYYAEAVRWAVSRGITNGTGETTFRPDEVCTRAQIVTMLWRAQDKPTGSAAAFSDVASDSFYAEAVAWAVDSGVTQGVGGGLFAPDSCCTRAQIVTMLWRALK